MHRRQLVAAIGGGLSLSLAGCTGFGNGPPDDWQTVRAWMDDAVSTVETGQIAFDAWLEEPAEAGTNELVEVAAEADALLGEYDAEVSPIEDEIDEWEFTATADDEEWDVDGQQLSDTLTGLWLVLNDVEVGYEWVEDADGDPDALDPDGEDRIENVFEMGDAVVAEARYKLTGSDG